MFTHYRLATRLPQEWQIIVIQFYWRVSSFQIVLQQTTHTVKLAIQNIHFSLKIFQEKKKIKNIQSCASYYFLTMEGIVSTYIDRLSSKHTKVIRTVPVWWQQESLKVECWTIDPDDMPVGFSNGTSKKSSAAPKFQYSISLNGKRTRPVAYRVPFFDHPDFATLTASHLCHFNECHNPDHLVLEPLAVNKGRNGCPAGPHCHHKQRCLIPGEFYDQ